jgi:hypothetical protein
VVSGAGVRPRGLGGGDADRGDWGAGQRRAGPVSLAAVVRWWGSKARQGDVTQGEVARWILRSQRGVGCDSICDLMGEMGDRCDRGIIWVCLLPLMMGQARGQVTTM